METGKIKTEAFETGYNQAMYDFSKVLDYTFETMSKKKRKDIFDMLNEEKCNSVAAYVRKALSADVK